MGLLKKIFKPVSKVLDKIIPNEIKPALPYLAAFAPYFGPTSSLLGKGIITLEEQLPTHQATSEKVDA